VNTIETKPLSLYKGERLIDALKRAGMENIPSNVVLDKTLPGIGATYTEIHAKRNSIIIEPNVPVIKGKVKKHENLNLLGVYEGITKPKIIKYLRDCSVKYKKILVTPEGYWKVRNAAKDIGLNIHADFFCMFDECERLNQDVGYRKKITNPVTDFFEFENKAFVSATPLEIHHPKIAEQGFYRLKIEPQFNYTKDIELIITNDFVNVFLEKLEALSKVSRCICIFYNSTSGIDSIIHSLRMQYSYKTFCSPKSKTKLMKLGFKNVESDFSEPLETYNFFTSRYFSAVDIEIKIKPDIILLTNLNQAEHTIIDPFTEAIQIQGRFRNIFEDGKNYNTLTHITNFKGDLKKKSDEEIGKEVEQYRRTHQLIVDQLVVENNAIKRKAIQKDLKRISFFELLDDNGNLDDFAVHNLYNEERVKAYYSDLDSLHEAYQKSKFFNVSLKTDLRFNLDEIKLKIRREETKKKKIIRIIDLLDETPDVEKFREMLIQDSFEEANTIIDAFLKLGKEFIFKVDYSVAKIKKELEKIEDKEKRFGVSISLEIWDSFELGVKQDRNIYKQKLQEIYSRYGISKKVTLSTIRDYFEVKEDKGAVPPAITLIRCVLDFGGKK
jgi:hypothetical protein